MKRSVFFMSCLWGALISGCAPSPNASESIPSQVAILPVKAGKAVLQQCSRATINTPESFWVPTSDEVNAIEQALPQYLSRSEVRQPSKPLEEFSRQYSGVIAQGQRLVYINFFPGSSLDFSQGGSWRTEPVIVCDGGDSFWGIVYNVDQKTFEPPQFNGEA